MCQRQIEVCIRLLISVHMDRNYDIFEMIGENPIWRGAVPGHDAALARLRELASKSQNEFRLMHIPTNALIAVIPANKVASGG